MNQLVRTTVIGTGPKPALSFAFWNVRPDIVTDNLARFAAASCSQILCHEVGGDYGAWMDQAFDAGTAPMVFYAQRAEASEWDQRGQLAVLDDAMGVAGSLVGMDHRLIDGARNSSGHLIGLTYYNGGPFALFRHADAEDVGAMATWEALLETLRRLQKNGMPHPFVPRWHETQTGLVWSLLCHLATEGVLTFDDPAAPRALANTLRFFKQLCQESLVPLASLYDKNDTAAIVRWASGRHAMTFTMDYLAADAANLAGRPISVPQPLPGKVGTALFPGHALICMNAKVPPAQRASAEALLAFMGGRDSGGAATVHRRWLTECLFAVPYPDLEKDPAVRELVGAFFPKVLADESMALLFETRNTGRISPPTHAAWFLKWSAKADALIRSELLGDPALDEDAVAHRLLDYWDSLLASHR